MESANPKTDPIRAKLNSALKIESLDIVDESGGCGDKYSILIISEDFAGLPLVDRHRKTYEILEEEMELIHALSLKTYTKSEFEKKMAKK